MKKAQSVESDEVEHQDVSLAWLMGGVSEVQDLYLDRPVPHEVSMEAWAVLHATHKTNEELALFLAYVHSPMIKNETV